MCVCMVTIKLKSIHMHFIKSHTCFDTRDNFLNLILCLLSFTFYCKLFYLSLLDTMWRITFSCSVSRLFVSFETLVAHRRHWMKPVVTNNRSNFFSLFFARSLANQVFTYTTALDWRLCRTVWWWKDDICQVKFFGWCKIDTGYFFRDMLTNHIYICR